MVVFMKGQTIGTMLISRVAALGEVEAMSTMSWSHVGALDMAGTLGTEVEQTIGKELVMMTTDGEMFIKERLMMRAGEGIIIEETNSKEEATTRKVIGQVRGMETIVGNNSKPQGLAVYIMAGAEAGTGATGEVQDGLRREVLIGIRGEVQAGMRREAQVGTMMESRGEPSWTGKPTWRGPRSLLRGRPAPVRGILTILSPVRIILTNLSPVGGIPTILTQVRDKIDQDRERSLYRVRAVPLPSLETYNACLPS